MYISFSPNFTTSAWKPPTPHPRLLHPLQGCVRLWRSQARWTTETPSSPAQLRGQVPDSSDEWFPQGLAILMLRSRRVPSSTEGFRWSIRSPRVWSSETRVAAGQSELPHRGHLWGPERSTAQVPCPVCLEALQCEQQLLGKGAATCVRQGEAAQGELTSGTFLTDWTPQAHPERSRQMPPGPSKPV